MSFDTSFYYRLTNKFQGPSQSLDVHSDGSRRLKMAPTANFNGQHWRLVDLGNNKYALRTEYLGDCFSLDVINDGVNDKPWLNTTGNFTGQSWTLTPSGDTYKLTNDFTGPGKSLNVYAQSFEPFVGPGDYSGQHWVLTPLNRISVAAVPDLNPERNPRRDLHNEGPSDYNTYVRPIGTVRAVMIFVDFPDAPHGSLTTQQAADHVLGREKTPALLTKRYAAVRLFNEESYGKLTLDVDVKSDLGWGRMPKRSDAPEYNFYDKDPNNGRADRQRNYITDAAMLFTPMRGSKVSFAAYSIVYIVTPDTVASPISPAFNQPTPHGALTLTGEIRLAVTFGRDIHKFRYITLVHETGHLFDLPDLYEQDKFAEDSKAGSWDIMSDTFRAASFLGWHRHKNGWLDASRKLYLTQPASDSGITLSPLSGSCGTSMVVLPIDNPAKPSKVFVIELAPPILGWPGNPPVAAKGILVYTVDATVQDLHAPLVVIPKITHPKTARAEDDPYGPLRDAAYDVGDHMSAAIGGASLAVKVNQKIGDSYNISISYGRQ